jgi:hypothetical protein
MEGVEREAPRDAALSVFLPWSVFGAARVWVFGLAIAGLGDGSDGRPGRVQEVQGLGWCIGTKARPCLGRKKREEKERG